MPIAYRIVPDQKVAYIRAWGKVSGEEIMREGARMFAEREWKNGFNIWSTNPLIGVGYRQYQKHAIKAGYRDLDLESEHFEILVSAGVIGFLPYVGLLYLMAYDGFRHYRGRVAGGLADRDLVAVFWGILLGYVITAATAQINSIVIIVMLFALTGAIIYARCDFVSTRPG